jgi:hypothetical protein
MPCGAQQNVIVFRTLRRRIHIGQPVQRGQGRQGLLEKRGAILIRSRSQPKQR